MPDVVLEADIPNNSKTFFSKPYPTSAEGAPERQPTQQCMVWVHTLWP